MRSRRAWRAAGGALFCGAAVWALHAPLLRGAAEFLAREDRPQGRADRVAIIEGRGCVTRAAAIRQTGLARDGLLLLETRLDRLERMGIEEERLAHMRGQLLRFGVAPEAIEVIPGGARDFRTKITMLGDWLIRHPDAEVLALVDEFSVRAARRLLERRAGTAAAWRVRWLGLGNPLYDRRAWWRSRFGARAVWDGYVRLFCVWTQPEPPADPPDWNPDDYERALAEAPR